MATARGALARARSERRSAWRRADETRNARAEREAAAAMATRFLGGMRRYAVTRRATGSDGFSGPLVVPRRPTCRSCEPSVRIRVLRLFFCMLLSYTVNLLGVNQGPPLLEDDFRVSHTFSAARRGEKAASWGRTRSRRRARPPRREPARVALAAADRSEGALPSFPGFLVSPGRHPRDLSSSSRCPRCATTDRLSLPISLTPAQDRVRWILRRAIPVVADLRRCRGRGRGGRRPGEGE